LCAHRLYVGFGLGSRLSGEWFEIEPGLGFEFWNRGSWGDKLRCVSGGGCARRTTRDCIAYNIMYRKCFGGERVKADGAVGFARWYNPHMHFAMDWPQGLEDVIKLFVAYVFALPVGWYREREANSVGVGTFPVVAVASCGYVLLGAPSNHASLDAQSRIIQGVVAGIGFIGG